MPDVDVFLSQGEKGRHGLARVWPPVVVLSRQDPDITFHNCTADEMTVTLEIPVSGDKRFVVDSGQSKQAIVEHSKAPRGETLYEVICAESGERARGLSHPIIIIR